MIYSRQGCRRGLRARTFVRFAATVCVLTALPSPGPAHGVEPGSSPVATPPAIVIPPEALRSSAGAGTAVGDLPQRLSSPAPDSLSSRHGEAFTDLRRSVEELREYRDASESRPIYDVEQYPRDGYLDWTPQILPDGIVYKAYLAGVKESRMATTFEHDETFGSIWDITLGGRVGLFRFGSCDPVRPEGFQIDMEGAAMPRLSLNRDRDMIAADFRAGLPITYGVGRWQSKFAFYHLSSHLGDEYAAKNPGFRRVNYSRDVLVLGQSYYVTDALRVYGEAGWAAYSDVSEPWEFQTGVEYSPLVFNGARGSPFAAVNAMSREEVDFGGNVVVQAGWQWRGLGRSRLLRVGVQYYNGKSSQFQLYDFNENRIGFGVWGDY